MQTAAIASAPSGPRSIPAAPRTITSRFRPSGGRVLTTQLYFPNEPANRRDSMFRRELLMKIAQAGDGQAARFDFVLDIR